jgi:hypothetical protein
LKSSAVSTKYNAAVHDKLSTTTRLGSETLERIYIGHRFKNDTERLEKLFELYTQMTARETQANPKRPKTAAKRRTKGDEGA